MAETVTMPKMGFDMSEGTLVRWVKGKGESVAKGEILAEIETDKATVEVDSPYDGIVHQLLVDQGSVVPVGAAIAIISAPGEKVEEAKAPVEEVAGPGPVMVEKTEEPSPAESRKTGEVMQPVTSTTPEGRIMASPLAKRMALEQGLNLAGIKGSGPEGRVVRKDIEAYLSSPTVIPEITPTPAATGVQTQQVLSPVMAVQKSVQVIPVERLRAAIGRRMTDSKQHIPHIYLTREYKLDALIPLRQQLNQFLLEGQKLTVNDFVIKAAALALRSYPNLNASLSENKLILHGHVNIGVAVALEGGLMTVVCRDADIKSLSVISAEIREKAAKARTKKVSPEDIEGSTFSISNLGMYHIESFGAIINPPEAAILAVGVAQQVPVVVDGELTIGWRMKVTLASDHRITDGAESAEYLEKLREYLEEPLRLVI
jgi:pyruvate dehydrogenase E2 component (dihydrolipoamide acetyltransferase)